MSWKVYVPSAHCLRMLYGTSMLRLKTIIMVFTLLFFRNCLSLDCGLCNCLQGPGDNYSLYCLGPKIQNDILTELNETVKQHIFEVHIYDTQVRSLSENFCAWKQLMSIHLSNNLYLNCSTLFRTVPYCVDVYGQCRYLHTPMTSLDLTTTEPPPEFEYVGCVSVLSVLGGLMTLTSCLLAWRYKRVYRYDIYNTTL